MNHESSECFDQAHRWWGTALWQPAPSCRVRYSIQVSENFFDHGRIFNAGDDFDGATTFSARFNVDVEHPFEPLCSLVRMSRCREAQGSARAARSWMPGDEVQWLENHLGGAVGVKICLINC